MKGPRYFQGIKYDLGEGIVLRVLGDSVVCCLINFSNSLCLHLDAQWRNLFRTGKFESLKLPSFQIEGVCHLLLVASLFLIHSLG